MLEFILAVWFLHVLAALFLSYPFFRFGWKRAEFKRWEAWAFVAPYCAWCVSLIVNLSVGNGKSLANMAGEPFLISVAIAIAIALRVIVGGRRSPASLAGWLLGTLCVASFALDCLTTGWPE